MSLCSDNTTVVSATGATFPTASGNIASLTHTAGVIVITGTATVASCVVSLTPTTSGTSVNWSFTTGGTGCSKSKTGVG